MTQYIAPAVETDPSVLLQRIYDYLQANIPGWVPSTAQLDVWMAQAFVGAVAEARDTASAVPTSIYRWFGATLIGVQPVDASYATVTVKFTAADTAGYTVPAGTQIGIYTDGINYWPFRTLVDAVIPAGVNFVDNVQVQAMQAGAAGSNLGGVGVAALLLDILSFVTSVTLDGATSGGVDAETDDAYLTRLTAELQLLAPRPILPNDFAVLARNIAGVYRAAALDGYNPGTATFGNERYCTVAVQDINGADPGTTIKNAVAAYEESLREINFVVPVIGPNANSIQLTYTVQSLPGVDKVALKAAVDAALKGYLNPATWGASANDAFVWRVVTLIRYNKLVQVVSDVTGVDYIVSLLFGPNPGALGTTDVVMTGVAPVPQLLQANISGTVT